MSIPPPEFSVEWFVWECFVHVILTMCSCCCFSLECSSLPLSRSVSYRAFKTLFKCPLLGQTFWILNAEGRPLQDILFLFLSTNHTVSPLPVYMFTSPIELWAPWAEGQCLIHFVSPSPNLMTGHSGCSGKVFDWCVEDTVLQGRILNHFVFHARKWLSNKASPGHGQIRAALGVNLFRSLIQIERGKPPVTQRICAAHGETQLSLCHT